MFSISENFFGFCFEGVSNGKLVGMVDNSFYTSMVQNYSIYIESIQNETFLCRFFGLQFFQCGINYPLAEKSILILNNTSNTDYKMIPLDDLEVSNGCLCFQEIERVQLDSLNVIKLKLSPFNIMYNEISPKASVFFKSKPSDNYQFLMNTSVKTHLVPDSLVKSNGRIMTYIEIPFSKDFCFFKPVDLLFIIFGKQNCRQLMVLDNFSISEEHFLQTHHCTYNMSDKNIGYSFPTHYSAKLIKVHVCMDNNLTKTGMPSNSEKENGHGIISSSGKFEEYVSVIFQYCELLQYKVEIRCVVIGDEVKHDLNLPMKVDQLGKKTFWIILGVCLFILLLIVLWSIYFLRLKLRSNSNRNEYVEEEMLRMVPTLETT